MPVSKSILKKHNRAKTQKSWYPEKLFYINTGAGRSTVTPAKQNLWNETILECSQTVCQLAITDDMEIILNTR